MEINTDIKTIIASLLAGSGISATIFKLLVKDEAKKALSKDTEVIHNRIDRTNNKFEEHVTCKYCNMQHDNIDKRLDRIESKIDISVNVKRRK